jgi:hypothetical protein
MYVCLRAQQQCSCYAHNLEWCCYILAATERHISSNESRRGGTDTSLILRLIRILCPARRYTLIRDTFAPLGGRWLEYFLCRQRLETVIFIIKPTRCTNFSNLFWNKTLHVSDSSFVHHQEFITAHKAMTYVIQVCRELSSRIRMELQFHPDPARKLSTNLYDIYHCCVYSEKSPDDGQRYCPKHLEFHSKIN